MSTSAGLPGRIRVPNASELEAIEKVIESVNAVPGIPDVPQQFWTDDADIDCAVAAGLFVTAGAALAAGQPALAAGLAAAGAQAAANAWKAVNKDTKSGCGIEMLETIASLDDETLKGATNSISLSGLMAARNILISAAARQG